MKLVRLLAIAAVLVSPLASHAATTSPGKNAVHSDVFGVLDASSLIDPPAGQILKGKKNTVVEIQATVSVVQNASLKGLQLFAAVNGVVFTGMGTTNSQCDVAAAPSSPCTLTVTFWMDVDAAETAYPGTYVGQPLNITLNGGDAEPSAATVGLAYSARFSARVGKK
jgi:hypothetical protein